MAGRGFVLASLDDPRELLGAERTAFLESLGAYLTGAAARCVLVRPDTYAFGTADGAEAAGALVDALRDALREASQPVPAPA